MASPSMLETRSMRVTGRIIREGKVDADIAENENIEKLPNVGVAVTRAPKVSMTDSHDHEVAHDPTSVSQHKDG
ncbi:hypothetical protein OBBRIDRAFT_888291 [Obba rivulosa]|uniref:Uncharacterized protein n=1 Tax=Obba rivulosa TaxID=1052685 RepID=A0A8E2AZT1_9APHY|nr:hypothetical protein OBBRIDRAFT_888291 [Obba rivulosa]